MERHGQIAVDGELRAALLSVSPATIDRLLSEIRIAAAQRGRRRAGFSSAVRRSLPVRTFADWRDSPPGFVEMDFVAHSGPSVAGAFVQTMVLTDIACAAARPVKRARSENFCTGASGWASFGRPDQ